MVVKQSSRKRDSKIMPNMIEFKEKYKDLFFEANGEDMISLDNLKILLNKECLDGNPKAFEFLRFINQQFPQ